MRWRYFIPFIVIFSGLLIAALTIDWWMKWTFESAGSYAVGARVDIERLHVSYFPLALHMGHLEITNPSLPMTNIVEIDKVDFDLETRALLEKKWVINQVAFEGISVNTPRAKSGALAHPKKKTTKSELTKELEAGLSHQWLDVQKLLPKIDIPKLENLEAMKAYEKSKSDLAELQKKWADVIKGKPFDTDMKTLQKEVAGLQATHIGKISSPQDLAKIQAAINNAQAVIVHAQALSQKVADQRKVLDSDMARVSGLPASIKAAGDRDCQRLIAPFSLKPLQQFNFGTAYLMAPIQKRVLPWTSRLETALYYKKKLAIPSGPKLHGRDRGEDIFFETVHTYPKFWVKSVVISGRGKQGEFVKGSVTNVASDQKFVGQPMIASVEAEHLLHSDMKVSLSFSHADSSAFSLIVSGVPLAKKKLSGSDKQHVDLETGVVGFSTKAQISHGVLMSDTVLAVDPLEVKPYGFNADAWSADSILADVLGSIHRLDVSLKLSGPFKSLHMGIETNVDNVFKSALDKAVQKRLDQAKADVQKEIDHVIEDKQKEVDHLVAEQRTKWDAWMGAQQKQVDALKLQVDQQKNHYDKQLQDQKKQFEVSAKKQGKDAARKLLKKFF